MFRHAPELTTQDLQSLAEPLAKRVGRTLQKHGRVEPDNENAMAGLVLGWLSSVKPGPLDDLIGHSITYLCRYVSRSSVFELE